MEDAPPLDRIGSTIAPPRFLLFLFALATGTAALIPLMGVAQGIMAAFVFNIGVLAFSINVLGS